MQVLPGHTITVMAPITMTNLLPYELTYEVSGENGRIPPGCSADLHCSNLEEQLEINIQLDGYPGLGTVFEKIYRTRFAKFRQVVVSLIIGYAC